MERRSQPRVQTEGVVRVRILAGGRLERGSLFDLNNAGAFIATDLVLEKGEKVHLELELPGDDEAQPLQAIVARCSGEIQGRKTTIPAGLGVVFIAKTSKERQLIQKVVMTTLALDLLGYGYRKGEGTKEDTVPPGEMPFESSLPAS